MASPHFKPGFNPMAISWSGPDEPPADTCSYCEAPIGEDEVPLMLFNRQSWCARFCSECSRRWIG